MTDETNKGVEPPKPKHKPKVPRKPCKPKQPGKPKKKTARQREAAQKRAAELNAIHWLDDPKERRIADARFQRKYIKQGLLAREGRLQCTKWTEYRYMSPLECTEQFAQEYLASYRRTYARHFDPKVARKKQPVKPNFGENSVSEMNAIWKARQLADELGIPYDVFSDVLIEGKIVGDKWRQPPLPNQLLSGNHTRARLRGRPTPDEVRERLFQPNWDRRFFAARSEDDPVQAVAMLDLRVIVLCASDRPQQLAKYLSIPGLLSEARARTLFDADLVDKALALRPVIRPGTSVASGDYVPACIGNRNTQRHSPCSHCPVVVDCTNFKRTVTRSLINTTGTADPRREHKRQVDRDRQRRHRERKKPKGRAA
jgi:hypothetical protein